MQRFDGRSRRTAYCLHHGQHLVRRQLQRNTSIVVHISRCEHLLPDSELHRERRDGASDVQRFRNLPVTIDIGVCALPLWRRRVHHDVLE